MKIILLDDIENLGKKYDVKDVKDGYARNFLMPKKLAKPATVAALKWLESQKEVLAKKAEDELGKFQKIAADIDGREILISVKVGDNGQLFEHITSQKVCEKINEMGFGVKKSQIELENPIKEIGDYPVKIKFEHNLEANIKIIISPEGEVEGDVTV